MKILQELSVDVERTKEKYKNHPKFMDVVTEFSKLLYGHIEEEKKEEKKTAE
jgi:hypothetical protein